MNGWPTSTYFQLCKHKNKLKTISSENEFLCSFVMAGETVPLFLRYQEFNRQALFTIQYTHSPIGNHTRYVCMQQLKVSENNTEIFFQCTLYKLNSNYLLLGRFQFQYAWIIFSLLSVPKETSYVCTVHVHHTITNLNGQLPGGHQYQYTCG